MIAQGAWRRPVRLVAFTRECFAARVALSSVNKRATGAITA
jgi:hypothetical protein